MNKTLAPASSETEHPQVAIRRDRKARQKALHQPKDPNGRAARITRADKTLASLNHKFSKSSVDFRHAISDTLDAYAKAKPRQGTRWTAELCAFAALERDYKDKLSPAQINVIKAAIKAELAVH